ncbi:hypothetical protein AAZX31_02G225200 [Glycine max]
MGSTLEYQTQEQAPTNLDTLFPHVWVLLYVSLVFLTLAGEVWVLRETLGGERLFSEFPKSALMTRESVMEDEKLCDAVNRHSSLSPAQVDEAMWVTEKAMLKAKSEWKEAHALMEDLMFKPQFLTFKAWVWAAATISSQTMHIPWDEAGCLCLVGDLFNYDAPGMEPSGIEDLEHFLSNSSIHDTSLLNGDNNIMVDADHLDSHSEINRWLV